MERSRGVYPPLRLASFNSAPASGTHRSYSDTFDDPSGCLWTEADFDQALLKVFQGIRLKRDWAGSRFCSGNNRLSVFTLLRSVLVTIDRCHHGAHRQAVVAIVVMVTPIDFDSDQASCNLVVKDRYPSAHGFLL